AKPKISPADACPRRLGCAPGAFFIIPRRRPEREWLLARQRFFCVGVSHLFEGAPVMSFRSYLMSRFPLRCRKAQPARSKPHRTRLEAIEDRITPAFASVNVTFQILTPSILTLVDQPDPDHGTYVNPQPPATIIPGATANWRTESSGTLT